MVLNTTEIKTFIDQNIKKVKSIHTVSDSLHISYDFLRKSFLRIEQMPMAEYITRNKVEAMKLMLLHTDHPCFYICYEFGFREDSGAKVFKKTTGMTMLEYRRRYQNSKAMLGSLRNGNSYENIKQS
ncbi:MAG: AraC family transcriptional regulator [Bacteroidota bacterium]